MSFNTNISKYFVSDMALFFFLLAIIVAVIFMIDPSQSYLGLYEHKFIKYLPIELSIISAFLYGLNGAKIGNRKLLYLILFGLWVSLGGIYTVFVLGLPIKESFVGRGLVIFLVYPAYCMAKSDRHLRLFMKTIAPVAIFAAVFILSALIVWNYGFHFVSAPHVFHTQVIIPVSVGLCILFFYRKKNPILGYGLGVLFLSSGMLLFKNTGFLSVLIALALFFIMIWSQKNASNKRMFIRGRVMVFMAIFVVVTSLVFLLVSMDWSSIYSYMPSGSPAVRLKTYLDRFEAFLQSPIVGSLFVGSPIEVLATKYGELEIPSHSDLLDILAFGGLLGLGMFFMPIVFVLVKLYSNIKNIMGIPFAPLFLWSYVYVLLGTMVLMVNPIWSQPEAFTLLMLALGVLFSFLARRNKGKLC